MKELDQRKLNLPDNFCFYILKRITRDYKSVVKLVKELDKFSLESKTAIELLEPSSNQSVIKKYLNKKGLGIHHIEGIFLNQKQ